MRWACENYSGHEGGIKLVRALYSEKILQLILCPIAYFYAYSKQLNAYF